MCWQVLTPCVQEMANLKVVPGVSSVPLMQMAPPGTPLPPALGAALFSTRSSASPQLLSDAQCCRRAEQDAAGTHSGEDTEPPSGSSDARADVAGDGYLMLTLTLGEHHLRNLDAVASVLLGFQTSLAWHVKMFKASLHSRMRARMTSLALRLQNSKLVAAPPPGTTFELVVCS